MKSIYLRIATAIFLFFALVTLLPAQGTVSSTESGGIRVLHKKVPGDVISIRMYLLGGTANYEQEQEGIEGIALELALHGGSEKTSARELEVAMSRLGMGVSSKAGLDYSYAGMTCLKPNFTDSWNLWAEALTQPSFDAAKFERFKEDYLFRMRRQQADPGSYIERLATQSAFGNTDYTIFPEGSSESLDAMTVEDVRAYFEWIMTKTRILIVAVGNIETDDLNQKVADTFGSLPIGDPLPEAKNGTVSYPAVTIVHRDIDNNHLLGLMPAPFRDSEEKIANLMAMSLLNDRFEAQIRNRERLSSNPAAYANSNNRYPSNSIYAATQDPINTVKSMLELINQIRETGFTEEELSLKKPRFLSYYYLSEENTDAQAHAIGDRAAAGRTDYQTDITDKILAVKLSEVNEVFRKYTTMINWTYLGNASQIETPQFLQPDVPKEEKVEEE
jgi:predicted Zn-dependent peptidase